MKCLLHALLPLLVLPGSFLFPQLGLLLTPLLDLDFLFSGPFFDLPHVILVGLLPLPLDLELFQALFLFPDTDFLLALPFFDHLGVFCVCFLSFDPIFLDFSLSFLLDP